MDLRPKSNQTSDAIVVLRLDSGFFKINEKTGRLMYIPPFESFVMQIIVASQNPVKIDAVRQAFAALYPRIDRVVKGIAVPSGVADQPMTEEETRQGALNRATNAREKSPEADFWVGVEGGIEDRTAGMLAFAWIVVLSSEQQGLGRTASFFLPPAVADLVRQGIELGVADDRIFGKSNSKQQNGAVGLLTHDAIVRQTLYSPAVIMALIPFLHPDLFPTKGKG